MPTCIEARVRRLGLKKTSATDLPASGLELTSPRLKRSADSSRRSSSARVQSAVVRKSFGMILNRQRQRRWWRATGSARSHFTERFFKRHDEQIRFLKLQTERRKQPEHTRIARRARDDAPLE